MPDDNVPSCNRGMKWSRKCEDKRKNCFDLRAFVNDSPIGPRLSWFSSFTALHLSRYGETISGSLGHNNLTRQHSIDTISIHDYQRDSGRRNCPTLVMWIYLFHIFFWRQIWGNQFWGWIFKFHCHFALFFSVAWDFPRKNQMNECKMKKTLFITAEMAPFRSVSGDVASLINSAFYIFRVACPGEVEDRTGYFTWYHQLVIYGLLSFLWHLSRVFIVHNLTKCLSGFSCSSVGAAEF